MKLYELTRDTYFTLPCEDNKEVYKLDHLDGMYSVCYDQSGQLTHVFCSEEVIINP
jgi:hypothetical protein